jgi:hypothetical protein
MGELYEKQEDGTLKPVEYPEHLVKKLNIYLWLKRNGLNYEEIKYLPRPVASYLRQGDNCEKL